MLLSGRVVAAEQRHQRADAARVGDRDAIAHPPRQREKRPRRLLLRRVPCLTTQEFDQRGDGAGGRDLNRRVLVAVCEAGDGGGGVLLAVVHKLPVHAALNAVGAVRPARRRACGVDASFPQQVDEGRDTPFRDDLHRDLGEVGEVSERRGGVPPRLHLVVQVGLLGRRGEGSSNGGRRGSLGLASATLSTATTLGRGWRRRLLLPRLRLRLWPAAPHNVNEGCDAPLCSDRLLRLAVFVREASDGRGGLLTNDGLGRGEGDDQRVDGLLLEEHLKKQRCEVEGCAELSG